MKIFQLVKREKYLRIFKSFYKNDIFFYIFVENPRL